MISCTNSPHQQHTNKSEKKAAVLEKVKLKRHKSISDDSKVFKKNGLPSIKSAKVIIEKNESNNKEPLEYVSAEVVKTHCPSIQSEKGIKRKLQSEKKEKSENFTEVKKIRKSNRERKPNQCHCCVHN